MKTRQVEEVLKENNRTWDEFMKWMEGQTVGVYPEGDTNYYNSDVQRFLRNRPIID